ncbi:FixH family protein [Roseomonas terrae]|jgi:nitrogen fixation protein FixH|uniref:FixH family protein n=1 Tax=Neoroseomonas terrae TaxID=424799 RepID=A0ABS5EMT9_9PROT|nr:FixH family protein [Neoroseomonas terrae]MBR0652342.1 FixH family protein [Neoroseomonas terrae]
MSATIERGYDPKRSRWIPWVFVGGFAAVFTVNMLMIYYAISTFTGVTVTHAYERGRGYDAVLAEAARQDLLGWHATVTLAGGRVSVAATDRDGRPLHGRMEGVLQRPLERAQLPLTFAPRGDGHWAAEVAPPQSGQWEARLTLFGPDDVPFDIRQRVVVP